MTTPGTQRRKDRLAQIEKCVCSDRQNTYGDAEDNFANIAKFWNTWLIQRGILQVTASTCVEPHDVAVMSALIKIARLSTSPDHIDNLDDLAGYAVCGGGIRVAQKQKSDSLQGVLISASNKVAEAYKAMGFEPGPKTAANSNTEITIGSEWKNIQTNYLVTVLKDAGGWVCYQTHKYGILQAEREMFLRDFALHKPEASQPVAVPTIRLGSRWKRIGTNECVEVVRFEIGLVFYRQTSSAGELWHMIIEEFLKSYLPDPTDIP